MLTNGPMILPHTHQIMNQPFCLMRDITLLAVVVLAGAAMGCAHRSPLGSSDELDLVLRVVAIHDRAVYPAKGNVESYRGTQIQCEVKASERHDHWIVWIDGSPSGAGSLRSGATVRLTVLRDAISFPKPKNLRDAETRIGEAKEQLAQARRQDPPVTNDDIVAQLAHDRVERAQGMVRITQAMLRHTRVLHFSIDSVTAFRVIARDKQNK